jgi:Acetyltransferases
MGIFKGRSTVNTSNVKKEWVKNTEHPLFSKAWNLYKKSFPPEERRQLRTQRKIMNNPLYHFEIIIADNDEFIGFILWWNFENIRYVEHLATLPRLRGKGYGQHILKRFTSRPETPILLEVEHPYTDINKRRICFYQRLGFVVNEYEYKQPPHKKSGNYVPLILMTYPNVISKENIELFCQQYSEHASVYNYMPVVH